MSYRSIILHNKEQKSCQNQIPDLHDPACKESSDADGVGTVSHLDDVGIDDANDDLVVVVPKVMIEDEVAHDFDQS